MLTLKADNRPLENMDEGFSYLADNYNSGITTFQVTNSDDYRADDYLLLEHFGSEVVDFVQIDSVEQSTNTVNLRWATRFAHTESTKVTKIRYSMLRWYQMDGPDWDNPTSVPTELREWQKIGDNTTQWSITNPSGDLYKYTWTGTGKAPRVTDYFPYPIPSAGSIDITVRIVNTNFNSTNEIITTNGTMVYEVGEDFFTITNAAGLAESNKTTGQGYIEFYTQYQDIDADNFYTVLKDRNLGNYTGFGYFGYWNPTSHVQTMVKSPIPYLGFPPNTAKAIVDDFYSTLNNKELKLVSREDAFRWLSEGYSIALSELNIINKEYSAVLPVIVTGDGTTTEFALPANCSRIINVWDISSDIEVGHSPQGAIDGYNAAQPTKLVYYTRGVKDLGVVDAITGAYYGELYIGFSGAPDAGATYRVRYIPKAVRLTKNYDAVYLPDNNFYCLKDYMLFRASPKLNRGDGGNFFQLFTAEINRMKVISIKQDANLDSWGIAHSANV